MLETEAPLICHFYGVGYAKIPRSVRRRRSPAPLVPGADTLWVPGGSPGESQGDPWLDSGTPTVGRDRRFWDFLGESLVNKIGRRR